MEQKQEYDESFKRQLANSIICGEKYSTIIKKYNIPIDDLAKWVREYSNITLGKNDVLTIKEIKAIRSNQSSLKYDLKKAEFKIKMISSIIYILIYILLPCFLLSILFFYIGNERIAKTILVSLCLVILPSIFLFGNMYINFEGFRNKIQQLTKRWNIYFKNRYSDL